MTEVSSNGKLEGHLLEDEESLRFLHCLSSRDPATRQHAMEHLRNTIDGWLNGYGSPPDHPSSDGSSPTCDTTHIVQDHLPSILRLSERCPFDDVREWSKALLNDLRERGNGLKIPRKIGHGPSSFIPADEIVPVNTSENTTQMLFVDAFLQNNRLDHVTQLMGYHPSYLECFLRTQQYLLRGDGPLPFHYRHYIAIMAASRHQCAYLIHLHEQEFILQGGDQEWLKNPGCIPKKLRDLYHVNKLLAHRPWLLNKSHIEKLTRGKDNWSVSEVVQALILLAHFHALCSFVYGCGVKNEVDHAGHTYRPPSPSESISSDSDSSEFSDNADPEVGIQALMERIKQVQQHEEETTEEERMKRFEKVETQNAKLTTTSKRPKPKAEIQKYVEDPDFSYQDRGSMDEAPFQAHEYSWEDHGFSIANRLYSDIGSHLDEKFKRAYSLTYYTMGEMTDVDTTHFRMTIWNYIHVLYGIRHDDYDYDQVDKLLEQNLKAYIKTVTCYPERLTKKDYDGVMKGFKHSEKVHVNLVLLEARLQGELLYALRAVMQYMT